MGESEFAKFLQTTYKSTRRRTMETNNAKRVDKHKADRKLKRGDAYMGGRNIIEEKPVALPPKETPAERLSRMKIWQAEKKARKLAEVKSKKPIFRAGVVSHKGNTPPVFTDVKNIKIKKLPLLASKRYLTIPDTPQVVKRSTVKKNVNNKEVIQPKSTIRRQLPFGNASPEQKRVTRSQKAAIVPGLPDRRKRKSKKETPKKIVEVPEVNYAISEGVFKFTGKSPVVGKIPEVVTPIKVTANLNTSVDYVSPFVSVGRGKGSSRKEITSRKSKVFDPEEGTLESYQKQANYFETLLNNEIERLLQLCKEWEEYKTENLEQLTEDSQDLINLATGQSNLLISKKFEQFRGLINQCRQGTGEQKVNTTDLQGFWDMIYMQVENLDLRFNNLTKLRSNNWKEDKPVQQRKKTAKSKAPAIVIKKATKASSSLKSFMKAVRNKASKPPPQEDTDVHFNGGFFNISSPKSSPKNIKSPRQSPAPKKLINIPTPARTPRHTLLQSVLSSEASKRGVVAAKSAGESPSILMRVNSISKKNLLDNSLADLNKDAEMKRRTPAEDVKRKSTKENVRESINLISWDTPEGPKNRRTRKSARLSYAQ